MYFPYNDSQTKDREYSGHAHYFEGVIRALLDDPKGFTIKGFEEYDSAQEQEMLAAIQKRLCKILDMKDFNRNNPYFSLCGLNCKLCSMNISEHCGGCGFGNQSCPIARCSLEHGKPEYCFQCPEYPCKRYAHIDEADSFITHKNQKTNLEKMQRIGEEAYNAEQVENRQILDRLLAEYNDGWKKTLFCLSVNLMPLEDLRTVFAEGDLDLPVKDRARQMENRLKERSGVELKLRKKK